MHANSRFILDHVRVGIHAGVRGPYGNMIRFHTKVFKTILHTDTDGTAATPQPDDKIRPETTCMDFYPQPVSIQQLLFSADK